MTGIGVDQRIVEGDRGNSARHDDARVDSRPTPSAGTASASDEDVERAVRDARRLGRRSHARSFDVTRALDGCSFSASLGEIHAIFGGNGMRQEHACQSDFRRAADRLGPGECPWPYPRLAA